MNKRLNNRQHMIDAVLALLLTYEELLNNVAQFPELFARFREYVSNLNSLRAQFGTLRVPFGERRAAARDNYVLCLSRLCYNMIEVAKASGDKDTLATAEKKLPLLKSGNTRTAIDAGEIVLNLTVGHEEALKALSRGDETMSEAKAAFELFKDYGLKGSRRRTEASHVLERYTELQDETVDFIRSTMYAFVLNWSGTHPELFDLYERNMRIPDFSAARAASGEEDSAKATDPEDNPGPEADLSEDPVATSPEGGDEDTSGEDIPSEDMTV